MPGVLKILIPILSLIWCVLFTSALIVIPAVPVQQMM